MITKRNQEIKSLYLEGYKLQDIGDRYGITRERVRQILNKMLGTEYTTGYEIRKQRTVDFIDDVKGLTREDAKDKMRSLRMDVTLALSNRGKSRNVVAGGSPLAGQIAENIVSDLLNSHGIKNELMVNHCTFDILTDDGKKIEVKSAYAKSVTSKRQKSPMYRFRVKKQIKLDFCDYFIFYIEDTKDVFVIPNNEIGYVDNVYICYPSIYASSSKWMKFKNRYDLLKG